MPIPRLTRENLRLLQAAIEQALEPIAREHELVIQLGRGTFDPNGANARFQLDVATRSPEGAPRTREAADLEVFAAHYGFPVTYGQEFTTPEGTYTLVGARLNSPKYPLLGRCQRTGKVYKHTPESVARALGIDLRQTRWVRQGGRARGRF